MCLHFKPIINEILEGFYERIKKKKTILLTEPNLAFTIVTFQKNAVYRDKKKNLLIKALFDNHKDTKPVGLQHPKKHERLCS